MAGGSGCRSESWLAVRLGLKLKLGWELEWELESELELKLQPERELEWELELRPLKLDKYGGHPQNPDLGPKWQYVIVNPPLNHPLGTFLGLHFKNGKCCISPGRPSYTIPTFIRGFLSKVHLQGTLDPQSAWDPPHFHRFPSY